MTAIGFAPSYAAFGTASPALQTSWTRGFYRSEPLLSRPGQVVHLTLLRKWASRMTGREIAFVCKQ